MNRLEARYAEQLEIRKKTGSVLDYWFEGIKLRLADGAWFTVDFFVQLADSTLEAHEVKGFMREAANVRIKVAAEKYPFRFVIVRQIRGTWSIEDV